MFCEKYKITMGTAHCLLYQDRARGAAPLIDVQVNGGPMGILAVWKQKYLPCLTCELGKRVKMTGGKSMDEDVKALRSKQLDKIIKVISEKDMVVTDFNHRTCRKCGYHGPPDNFHKAGKHGATSVCRKCAQASWVDVNVKDRRKRVMVGKLQKVVDFTDYPELLGNLTSDANRNFRTLNSEILYRLTRKETV